MLDNMHALAKFQQYLVGNKFVVKTDHNSLRHFLTQKDLNDKNQKWVRKIQYYDFDIEYVKGKNKNCSRCIISKTFFFSHGHC